VTRPLTLFEDLFWSLVIVLKRLLLLIMTNSLVKYRQH